MIDDDLPRETPPTAIGAIAAAVGPLPFLIVYSVVFIGHGVFYPVEPPDITRTRTGEAIAGFAAVAVALVIVWTIWWFLSARRRWPMVLAQLAVLVTTIVFISDPNTGSPTVPLVLVVTSVTSLVLSFTRGANEHMGTGWDPHLPGRPRLPRPRVSQRRAYRGARRAAEGARRDDDSPAFEADRQDVSV